MTTTRISMVLAGLAAVALSVWADSNTMTGRPGFFEPTPDGNASLTKAPPSAVIAEAIAPPFEPLPGTERAAGDVGATPQEAKAQRTEAVREAEVALDRAEREHEAATKKSVQAASTIQGAFTGLTRERDR